MELLYRIAAVLLVYAVVNSSALRHLSAKDPCASVSAIYAKCMTLDCPAEARKDSLGQTVSFPAELADNCLRSIAFNKTSAKLQLREVTNFLQLYSAQGFWKTPPANQLDIEAVDLNATLSSIQMKIQSDKYSSNLQFDLAITDALNAFHDGHTLYSTRCSSTFVFLHDHPLVSISTSPDTDPVIYLGDPASGGAVEGGKVYQINGRTPEAYLSELAKSQPYWIDLFSRYSSIFLQSVIPETAFSQLESLGAFAAQDRLPSEPLKITLANGTCVDVKWRAQYNWFFQSKNLPEPPQVLPFNSSTDLEQLCKNPRFEPSDSMKTKRRFRRVSPISGSSRKSTARLPASYPSAVNKLAYNEVSYFAVGGKYGVIKFATFLASVFSPARSLHKFPKAVNDLIREALRYFRSHGLHKVVVDISLNPGGDINAGLSTFQAFFPSARPYYGEDMRSSPLLRASSRAAINESDDLTGLETAAYYALLTNTKGYNYSSLPDFLRPVHKSGDYFTSLSRKNASAFLDASKIANVSFSGPALFSAEDIILLSDSLCASTCSTFAEAMREMGVRSVAYGGPAESKGKLQVSGGTRG